MHPFEKPAKGLPPGVSPHLDVRLKPGWRFKRGTRALISAAGETFDLRGMLPPGTKVVPIAPSLAKSDPRDLSEDERLLARCVQIVPPSDTDPARLAAALRRLEGLEAVSLPPRLSLP